MPPARGRPAVRARGSAKKTPGYMGFHGERPTEPEWIDCEQLWQIFGGTPDLCLHIRGDAMNRAGLADGGIVALRLARDDQGEDEDPPADADIVAARVSNEVMLRRFHRIDQRTAELRAQSTSRRHKVIRVEKGTTTSKSSASLSAGCSQGRAEHAGPRSRSPDSPHALASAESGRTIGNLPKRRLTRTAPDMRRRNTEVSQCWGEHRTGSADTRERSAATKTKQKSHGRLAFGGRSKTAERLRMIRDF